MVIFTRNRLIGTLCLLVFLAFGSFSATAGTTKLIIYIVLGLVITAAAVVLISYVNLPKNDDFWLLLLPFTILMLFARIVCGWDITLPFLFIGLISLGLKSTSSIKEKDENYNTEIAKSFGSIAICIVLYICIFATAGVFI